MSSAKERGDRRRSASTARLASHDRTTAVGGPCSSTPSAHQCWRAQRSSSASQSPKNMATSISAGPRVRVRHDRAVWPNGRRRAPDGRSPGRAGRLRPGTDRSAPPPSGVRSCGMSSNTDAEAALAAADDAFARWDVDAVVAHLSAAIQGFTAGATVSGGDGVRAAGRRLRQRHREPDRRPGLVRPGPPARGRPAALHRAGAGGGGGDGLRPGRPRRARGRCRDGPGAGPALR